MDINTPLLSGLLCFLILLSAFFSGSETGMMALNRYRLRHLKRHGHVQAKRVSKLLERPDRLLGVILLGNTFSNVLASAVATVIAVHYFGELGVLVTTIVLTLVILIFAEAAPKTLSVVHPMRVAFFASFILRYFALLLYPLVFVINAIANGILRLFQIRIHRAAVDPLSVEELRTVVGEASGKISPHYQHMLLRILDLEQITVEDIMIPKNEIEGIDLDDSWDEILAKLTTCRHAHLPVYRDSMNKVCGMLNLRHVWPTLQNQALHQDSLLALLDKVYFVPEGALASQQLLHFQREKKTIGLVVDEYGDIQGLLTLQDIFEEIVGEFAHESTRTSPLIQEQKDGSYLVHGNIAIRELNRLTGWELTIDGPKTLSGLVIEYLETIPTVGIAARISGYPMEVMQVSGNRIKQVRVWPALKLKSSLETEE